MASEATVRRVKRSCIHKYMMPWRTCDDCSGRGWYLTDPEGPDEGHERYCACTAGDVRRRVDAGEDVEVEWDDALHAV